MPDGWQFVVKVVAAVIPVLTGSTWALIGLGILFYLIELAIYRINRGK